MGKVVLLNRIRGAGCGTKRDWAAWSAAECGVIVAGVSLGTRGGSAGGSKGVTVSVVDDAATSYVIVGEVEEERVMAVFNGVATGRHS